MPSDLENTAGGHNPAAIPLIGLVSLGVMVGGASALLSTFAGYGLWLALGVYSSTGATVILLVLVLQMLKISQISRMEGTSDDGDHGDAASPLMPLGVLPPIMVLIGRRGDNTARIRSMARGMGMATQHLVNMSEARQWFSHNAGSFSFIVADETTLTREEIIALRAARLSFSISGPFILAADAVDVLSHCAR